MQRRILIIRQDRIGDAVLATAIPRELKKRWPGCHVGVLVRGYTRPLFENNPHVDEIIVDDATPETRDTTFWPMVRRLRRSRFTHALMLLPEARYNYMTFCAGIPVRVGHGIILFHAITLARPVMTRKFQKGRHEAEYSMDLARSIGCAHRRCDTRDSSHPRGKSTGRPGYPPAGHRPALHQREVGTQLDGGQLAASGEDPAGS